MFIHQDLANNKELSNIHKIILARILAEVSINGYCDMTTKELAEEIRISKNNKKSTLKKIYDLEKNGYITIKIVKDENSKPKIKRIINVTEKYNDWIL